jgi:UMF1 family MFS transporter
MTHEGTWMVRFSLVITALYFAIFATPLFLWLQEKAKHQEMQKGENYLTVAVKRLRKTFASVRDHREFIKYIIAFLIYNDGILMMINFAAIFGVVMFGLAQQQIILFMILIQVTSVIGAFLSGWLTDFISAKKTLVIFLIMMLATVVGLFFNNTVTGFYVIGGMAGLALSSVQAVSRAMVGKLGPPGRSAEFYGFFAVAGRTSSFIGPAVYGWVAAETAYWFDARRNTTSFLWFRFLEEGTSFAEQIGQRAAVIPVMLFLIVGLLILFTVDEKSEMARHHSA